MTFKKGMKVVCIAKSPKWSDGEIKPGPKHNEVTTISDMGRCPCGCGKTGLSFYEYTPGNYYDAKQFRPIKEHPCRFEKGVLESFPTIPDEKSDVPAAIPERELAMDHFRDAARYQNPKHK